MANNFNLEEVNSRNKLIDDAIIQLKKEFAGIDYQIDMIMDNLRTWFLFPELQERPMIINLWGLSGCGKTALVRRISQLLDIEKDFVYFNFAQIDEMSSWEIEDDIEDELSNENSKRLFIYDEFQYAATLDEAGCEKDKKSGLKTFWELLDTGILHKKHSYGTIKQIYELYKYICIINDNAPIQLENGVWVNSEECLKDFTQYEISTFKNYFNFEFNVTKKLPMEESYKGVSIIENKSFFIQDYYFDKIFNFYQREHVGTDEIELNRLMCKMNIQEIKELLLECCSSQSKGYDLNFKDSVIFVIANLDEAYQISFDVNPDMSPDQFNKITKKLTIVDIKEALKKRFRNEQIARLGNIHVIYPSFSSSTFKSIIQMEIDKYIDTTLKETGYHIECDETINNLIYKEGVFPTHGTRPVFSTVQEIVKSKLPFVIKNSYSDGYIIDTIKYSFSRGYTYAEVYKDGEKLAQYKFKEKLRVENLRESKKDDKQALVAVHESGHFVMYTKLKHDFPKAVYSVTTESNTGGFVMEEIDDDKPMSAKEILDKIKISLGGYVAEEVIFGREHLTCGASSDLSKATVLASKYVREYCLGSFNYVSTYLKTPDITKYGNIVSEEDQRHINNEIKSVLDKCWNEVRMTFKNYEWFKMLKASAKYLSEHSSLTKTKMKELYDIVSETAKVTDIKKNYYKSIVDKF